MGYVVFALIILAFVGMGVWDHRTRKKGHTLRKDGMSDIRAARRRDARAFRWRAHQPLICWEQGAALQLISQEA